MSDARHATIAVLGSATIQGIPSALHTLGEQCGIALDAYTCEYNQYAQAILNPMSELYARRPDLIVLFIDIRTVLGERALLPYVDDDDARHQWVVRTRGEIAGLVDALCQHSEARIVLHNFSVPARSPLGIQEPKQEFGIIEAIETLNAELRSAYKQDHRVYLFDYDAFCARIGKDVAWDPKLHYLGDIQLALRHLPALCAEYLAYVKPIVGLTKKCIVLDLDHTLWGGVVGEDGMAGIRVGPTPEGRPFLEFQQALLARFQRGVILAINSRNNEMEALQVFREHPHMVLREEHFAAMRINWADKATNLRALAEEIGIGLESTVFIDDDPFQREYVRRACPEVVVVDLPSDPAQYVRCIERLDWFEAYELTHADRARGAMYAADRKRRGYQQQNADLRSYLEGLDTHVTIAEANVWTMARVAQLCQRTNQFTMTSRRYTEVDIERFMRSPHHHVLTASVRDRFGDSGLTGVVIVEEDGVTYRIDTLLLSCRVIGRHIEDVIFSATLERVRQRGATHLIGEFIPTTKNVPAKDCYKGFGFQRKSVLDGVERWVYPVRQVFTVPSYITVEVLRATVAA